MDLAGLSICTYQVIESVLDARFIESRLRPSGSSCDWTIM